MTIMFTTLRRMITWHMKRAYGALKGKVRKRLSGTGLPDVPDEKPVNPLRILKHLKEDLPGANLAPETCLKGFLKAPSEVQDDQLLVGEIRDAVAARLFVTG